MSGFHNTGIYLSKVLSGCSVSESWAALTVRKLVIQSLHLQSGTARSADPLVTAGVITTEEAILHEHLSIRPARASALSL